MKQGIIVWIIYEQSVKLSLLAPIIAVLASTS